MVAMEDIRKTAARVGRAANARRVYLFGSYARGDAREDSDVDLLVVAQSDLPRFKRSRALYRNLSPYSFPLDLLVYTPQEVEAERNTPASFVSHILTDAREVYVDQP